MLSTLFLIMGVEHDMDIAMNFLEVDRCLCRVEHCNTTHLVSMKKRHIFYLKGDQCCSISSREFPLVCPMKINTVLEFLVPPRKEFSVGVVLTFLIKSQE
jgi:hypothetical protein